jgi:carbon monoxide dehydrogenase subunit G
MDMQGSRTLAVTQQQAWDALNDPEVLKACIPGCDSIEATGDNRYALVNAISIGPVSAKFKGNLQLADIDAPRSYSIQFEGNGGVAGSGKGNAKVTLTPGDAGCELAYEVNLTVSGKIAQVGQRLIPGVAKAMAESFFTRFDEEMQKRYPPAAVAEAVDTAVTQAPVPGEGKSPPVWVGVVGIMALGVGIIHSDSMFGRVWLAAVVALGVGYWAVRRFGKK